jgi:hypothetical protein
MMMQTTLLMKILVQKLQISRTERGSPMSMEMGRARLVCGATFVKRHEPRLRFVLTVDA